MTPVHGAHLQCWHSPVSQLQPKYAEMEEPAYRGVCHSDPQNTLLVMLPVSLLFGAFGTPVIRVLFEGGDFNTHNAL